MKSKSHFSFHISVFSFIVLSCLCVACRQNTATDQATADTLRQSNPQALDTRAFVNVTDVVPDAILEIRYHSSYNFIGTRIDGYEQPVALMTRQSADSLRAVGEELRAKGYQLLIFDAYRPQRAVDHFVRWGKDISDTLMRRCFYPNVDKSRLFELGYIATQSSHSRGSTVDLTLFDMATGKEVDMGAPFDWFGRESHPDCGGRYANGEAIEYVKNDTISAEQFCNRMILREAMLRHGFKPYECEWWHFTLKNEPFPDTYFEFPVRAL
jgi:D-alanyl-D-alanine dipeptidase